MSRSASGSFFARGGDGGSRLSASLRWAGWLGLTPLARAHGWIGLVPTPILLLWVPGAGPEMDWPDWDSGVPMPTPAPATAEFLRRLHLNSISDWEFSLLLRYKFKITSRSRWPIDVPLVFQVRYPYWAVGPFTIPPHPLGSSANSGSRSTVLNMRGGDVIARRPDKLEKSIRLRWEWNAPTRFPSSKALAAEINHSIEIVSAVNDVLVPLHGREIDESMRNALHIKLTQFTQRSDGASELSLSMGFNRSKAGRLQSIACGFSLTIESPDGVLYRAIFEPPRRFHDPDQIVWLFPVILVPNAPSDFRASAGKENWIIRVRGDGEMGLTDWGRDEYWDGEFTVPLRDVLN